LVSAPSIQVSPIDSQDDAFITGIGLYFGDTPYIFLKEASQDIESGTRFRNVAIPQGEKINNATLWVRSVYDYPAAGNLVARIYGDNSDDSRAFNDSSSFTRTLTTSYVDWNTSEVNGNQWNNVTVTEIVQEIIDRVGWTSGNSLSLIIRSFSGTPRREFASVDGNPAYTAYIDINWGIPPPQDEVDDVQDGAPPPFNETDVYEWEYNETQRGIDVYIVYEWGDPIVTWIGYELPHTETYYQNITRGPGGETKIRDHDESVQDWSAPTILINWENWQVAVMDTGAGVGTTKILTSDDEFVSFTAHDINAEYGLAGDSRTGTIALDRLDNTTFHVVYNSPTLANPANQNIIYTNFTVNPLNGTVTFAPSYTNITDVAFDNIHPNIYCDLNGSIHVVYYGTQLGTVVNQAWYRKKAENGTWLSQVQVSDAQIAGEHHTRPDVVANEETGNALVVWEWDDTEVWWDIVFAENNTDGPDRVANTGNRPAMVNDRENSIAQLVWNTLVGPAGEVYYQYKPIDNSSAWSANLQVSGAITAIIPGLSINPNTRTLQAVWFTDANLITQGNFWTTGQAPNTASVTQTTNQDLYYNWLTEEFGRVLDDTHIFLVYPNGTLVFPTPLPDGVTPKEAIDELLGGALPDDPDTGKYTVLDKFRWKLLVLAVGMIMLLGSPIAGVAYGADTATWIKIMFIMFFGIGILWQIKYM
jgi:hypothetical protein